MNKVVIYFTARWVFKKKPKEEMKLSRDGNKNYSSTSPWIAFVRIFLGAFWLYEVTIGHNWKTGSFTSGPHPGWFGPEAGSYLIEQGNAGIEAGGWAWFGWFLENIMYPNAALWGYFAVAVQLILAFAFLFGIFVRPMALLGLSMDLFIFFLGNSRIPPFFSLGHLFVLFTDAGMHHGIDAWIIDKYKETKSFTSNLLRSIITLNFITPSMRRIIASICAILSVYFLLELAMISSGKMKMVSMDLAVLFGFVAFGLFVYKDKMDKVSLTVSLLRIWLGYRFLHEAIVRNVPAVNGLPGWGTKQQLTEVFQFISEKHWGIFSSIVANLFTPMAGIWLTIFIIVNTLVAIMLILGIRTRLASKIGLIYLSLLIVIGFTRYAPFVFGYLFAVYTLDGGKLFSFDSLKDYKPKIGISLSNTAIVTLFAVAVIAVVAANVDGILPDGYKTSMGPVMGAMVAMLTSIIGLCGAWQNGFAFVFGANKKAQLAK